MRIKKISTRGLLVDPIPNSPNLGKVHFFLGGGGEGHQ